MTKEEAREQLERAKHDAEQREEHRQVEGAELPADVVTVR
jgi:hypothetical protein